MNTIVLDDTGFPVVTAYRWLPGDFDERTLRRRRGWKLRTYRGVHRPGEGRLSVVEIQQRILKPKKVARIAEITLPKLYEAWKPITFSAPYPYDDVFEVTRDA